MVCLSLTTHTQVPIYLPFTPTGRPAHCLLRGKRNFTHAPLHHTAVAATPSPDTSLSLLATMNTGRCMSANVTVMRCWRLSRMRLRQESSRDRCQPTVILILSRRRCPELMTTHCNTASDQHAPTPTAGLRTDTARLYAAPSYPNAALMNSQGLAWGASAGAHPWTRNTELSR